MTVVDGKSATGSEKASAASGKDESPTEALTVALASAEAAFRVRHDGDALVMVAFSLGRQMAEVYRPDRRRSSPPAAQEDLPGIARLSAGELLEMGLFQDEPSLVADTQSESQDASAESQAAATPPAQPES